jgi:hypothetical protein
MARCLECHQVKVEHRKLATLLEPHVIPESKLEVISMEFIVVLPLMASRDDFIFVIIDILMKSAHFIPVCTTYHALYIDRLFVINIMRLHDVPKRIIYDQGLVFTGRFWTIFQEDLETQLNFSTTYHPKIDGKIERMN